MKKAILLAAVAVIAAVSANAQSLDGLSTGGWMSANQRGFFIDGESVSIKKAKSRAMPYRDAMKHIRRGQGWHLGGMILAGVGGAAIGAEIGYAISGEKMNGAGIATGLLLVGSGFGLELIAISQYKKAAAAYNSATGLAELPRRGITFSLAPTRGGLGLKLTF